MIVIETPDAVLVANRTRSQDVKHIVNALRKQGREEHTLHRPWGWYDSIDEGGRFKVKRIQVKPWVSISSLEIIEVQSGNYLGEDDIVRVCDLYGRVDDSRNKTRA